MTVAFFSSKVPRRRRRHHHGLGALSDYEKGALDAMMPQLQGEIKGVDYVKARERSNRTSARALQLITNTFHTATLPSFSLLYSHYTTYKYKRLYADVSTPPLDRARTLETLRPRVSARLLGHFKYMRPRAAVLILVAISRQFRVPLGQ